MYARKNRHGEFVSLKDRAEATAVYLRRCSGRTEGKTPTTRTWKQKLYKTYKNKKTEEDPLICDDGDITEEELNNAVIKLSRDKAPGFDDITTDWIKNLDQDNHSKLLELINAWWVAEKLPQDMLEAKVAPMYKKTIT